MGWAREVDAAAPAVFSDAAAAVLADAARPRLADLRAGDEVEALAALAAIGVTGWLKKQE